MKRLQFDYRMKIDYSEPVSAGFFTLKCFPVSDARQRVTLCQTLLEPDTPFSHGQDSFGNNLIYGAVKGQHSLFSVCVTGEVEITRAGYEAEEADGEVYLYRNGHGMNRAGPAIRAYYRSVSPGLPEDDLERAVYLMESLHRDFHYEKGCTDANTPAEEAFSQGQGVCQDYSHIFIALCQLSRIPARYVTGLLIGEGESHAWVEVLASGRWIGLDVTNDMAVTDSHIKFGHGRDAADCRINTGIVYGSAKQHQQVTAIAKQMEQ